MHLSLNSVLIISVVSVSLIGVAYGLADELKLEATDGSLARVVVQTDEGAGTGKIQFRVVDVNDITTERYEIRRPDLVNDRIEWVKIDPISGNRIDFTIDDNTGNVGIGWDGTGIAADELLEVHGNIKLSGDLVSDGDICIGTC